MLHEPEDVVLVAFACDPAGCAMGGQAGNKSRLVTACIGCCMLQSECRVCRCTTACVIRHCQTHLRRILGCSRMHCVRGGLSCDSCSVEAGHGLPSQLRGPLLSAAISSGLLAGAALPACGLTGAGTPAYAHPARHKHSATAYSGLPRPTAPMVE